MTATSESRVLLPNSRNARRISTTFKSNLESTESKPAFLTMPATAAASLTVLLSRATFLYAELPITNATRFSARAGWLNNAISQSAKTAALAAHREIPNRRKAEPNIRSNDHNMREARYERSKDAFV